LLASHPQIAFCVYFSVIFHLNGFSLTAWWKAFGKFSPSQKPLPRSHLLVLRLATAKKCQVGMKIIGSPTPENG